MKHYKWFGAEVDTVAKARKVYRLLAMKHHPDHGGNTRDMQEINAEYHEILAAMHGQTTVDEKGERHQYYYTEQAEQEIMDKIAQLLALDMDGVELEIIGTWLWLHGNTKAYKEVLKAAGCLWHGKRQMWYWHRPAPRRRYSNKSMDSLRAMYGSVTVSSEKDQPRQKATGSIG